MNSPGRAIAWEFGQRQSWLLIALAVYAVILTAVNLLFLGNGPHITLDPPNGMSTVLLVPFSIAFFYLIAKFSFGLSGDLGARQSIFPARMFTLPVTTSALAGWPMLFGIMGMILLWLATALYARWPWGLDLPLLWPALLCAVFLAWTQALMWMPYGLPGMRVIVAVLWLTTLDAVILLSIHFQLSGELLAGMLAPQIPVAYVTARFAVARARRGDVPDWRGVFARAGRIADAMPRRRAAFASAASAQAWFEWKVHGRFLTMWVAILLPFELAMLFLGDTFVLYTLATVLLTPPFMAGFAGGSVGRSNPRARDSHGIMPFEATRPVATASLIAARLRMSWRSTLTTWALVLVAIPLALTFTGRWPVVRSVARNLVDVAGTPRAVVLVVLILAGLMASTWKQLVNSYYIGLTGRGRLIVGRVAVTLMILICIGPALQWIHDNGVVLWDIVPRLAGVAVVLKIAAASWVAIRLHRNRLLSDRAFVTGAACWSALVFVLYGSFVWIVATPLIPRYLLLLIAILVVPLARLSAAPLALAWSRHR